MKASDTVLIRSPRWQDGLLPLELQLILSCARTKVDSVGSKRITDLVQNKEIDWLYLRRLADHHRVQPLFAADLKVLWGPKRTPPR